MSNLTLTENSNLVMQYTFKVEPAFSFSKLVDNNPIFMKTLLKLIRKNDNFKGMGVDPTSGDIFLETYVYLSTTGNEPKVIVNKNTLFTIIKPLRKFIKTLTIDNLIDKRVTVSEF